MLTLSECTSIDGVIGTRRKAALLQKCSKLPQFPPLPKMQFDTRVCACCPQRETERETKRDKEMDESKKNEIQKKAEQWRQRSRESQEGELLFPNIQKTKTFSHRDHAPAILAER